LNTGITIDNSLLLPLDFSATPGVGVMLCGHGSRNGFACEEFAKLANGLRLLLPEVPVEHGYLEFARPIIKDGLDKLRARGVNSILAIHGMLFAAVKAKNEITLYQQFSDSYIIINSGLDSDGKFYDFEEVVPVEISTIY